VLKAFDAEHVTIALEEEQEVTLALNDLSYVRRYVAVEF